MFHLKRNLSTRERVVRLCLGLFIALGTWYWLPSGPPQLGGYAVAVMLAWTAAVRFCPAYALLGRKPLDPVKLKDPSSG